MSNTHKPLSPSKPRSATVVSHTPLKTGIKTVRIVGEGLKIIPMTSGNRTVPTLIYRGDAPETGARVSFLHENGFTYTGTVEEVTTIDGEVLLTFVGELTYTK
jgi:hypothetical protein